MRYHRSRFPSFPPLQFATSSFQSNVSSPYSPCSPCSPCPTGTSIHQICHLFPTSSSHDLKESQIAPLKLIRSSMDDIPSKNINPVPLGDGFRFLGSGTY